MQRCNLLQFAICYGDVELARAIHASIFKLKEDTHLGNILIASICGDILRFVVCFWVFEGESRR